MSLKSIYAALQARLSAFAPDLSAYGQSSVPILQRGEGVAPPETGVWLEVAFLEEATESLGLSGRKKNLSGVMQVICKSTEQINAPTALLDLADQIAAHFPKGMAMAAAGVRVQLDQDTAIVTATVDEGVIERPVAVHWRAIV